jgi:hypothetical protein
MNYQKANEQLQGRNKDSRKLANHTYLQRRGENIAVKLHATDVVTFTPNGDCIFNSGGWLTDYMRRDLQKMLSRYILRQVGQAA